MDRCELSQGRYKVSLYVQHQPKDRPYHAQIGSHHDIIADVNGVAKVMEKAPWVGTDQPFEGELCEHELQFLGGLPGKTYPAVWEFTVEALDPKPAKA